LGLQKFRYIEKVSKVKRYWFIQIVCWTIYIIVFNWYYAVKYGHNVFFIESAIFLPVLLFSSHLYRILLKKLKINLASLTQILICSSLGILLLGGLFTLISVTFYYTIEEPGEKILKFGDYLIYFTIDCLIVLPWFACYHIYKYAESLGKIEMEKSVIEKEKMEAFALLKTVELANLKNQLNPHFLFNALNSIKALMLTQPAAARDAITQLSDLLRVSLNFGTQQRVSVQEEVDLVRDYLELEKMRFEDRLQYELQVADETRNIQMPPMVLQPIAENAIKHGIGLEESGGKIYIAISLEDHHLVLRVSNTGTYIPKNENGIGLRNLEKRLKLGYGGKACLQISSKDNTVNALIKLPVL
jgi:sensor histidine kinase YesM